MTTPVVGTIMNFFIFKVLYRKKADFSLIRDDMRLDNLYLKNILTKGEYPDLSGDHSESLVKKSAGNFVKNHKVGVGLGVAGTAAATALIAKKIAALRKQQKQNPGLSGKIQNLINMLKAKLRH